MGGRTSLKPRGSITVFAALLLTMVLLFTLVLTESSRAAGLKLNGRLAGEAAIDSMFAGFDRELLEEYGLLFYDSGFGKGLPQYDAMEDEFEHYFMENVQAGLKLIGGNFLTVDACEAEVLNMVCATDRGGEAFIRSVLDYYKYEGGADLAAKALEGIAAFEEADNADRSSGALPSGEDLEALVKENAEKDRPGNQQEDEGDSLKEDGEVSSEGGGEIPPEENAFDKKRYQQAIQDSPIGGAANVKAHGWMQLVLPEGRAISGREVRSGNLPSEMKRGDTGHLPEEWDAGAGMEKAEDLEKGADMRSPEDAVMSDDNGNMMGQLTDKAIFNEYVLDKFSCFTDETSAEDADLQYEVEYILYGKNSDEANLKTVINRLMWVREGLNFLYAAGNTAMRREALVMADVLVGWTELAFLIPIVQYALIAAWAYAESICDLRLLLGGGKVPLHKDETSWKLSLSGVVDFLSGNTAGIRSSDRGFNYRDYLRVLLYGRNVEDEAFRTMDLIQIHIQLKNPGFLMAAQVYSLEMRVSMQAKQLFTLLPAVNGGGNLKTRLSGLRMYRWKDTFGMSYG